MNPLDPSRGDAENAREELYGKYHQLERLEAELRQLAQHAAELQAVKSILRCELGMVIQSVRAFTNALCAGVPVLAQASWPGDVYRAWQELDETVRSAAKCLQ